jgi:hypothetical protein
MERKMKFHNITWAVYAAVILMGISVARDGAAQPICVDFESPLVPGTQYGAPVGNTVGEIVFSSGPIPVAVDHFAWGSGSGTFNYAEIDSNPQPVGSGQSITTNNINLVFDLSQVGFVPKNVTFAYVDRGGNENLSINGCPTFVGELSGASSSMCGATISVSPSGSSDGSGKVVIEGFIFSVKVGGQEFWMDDLCVYEK